MTDNPTAWQRMIEGIAPLGERAADKCLRPEDPQMRSEVYVRTAMGFVMGMLERVYSDPDYPDFTPHINNVINLAVPVPDFMYMAARINGAGTYRLSGFRGTNNFTDVNIREGQYADRSGTGRNLGVIDMDDVPVDANGYFSLVMSAERPVGYDGHWVRLEPTASFLLVRHAACDWLNEIDCRMAIERLDIPAPRPRASAEDIAERLDKIPYWTEIVMCRWLDFLKGCRQRGLINTWEIVDYTSIGGAQNQVYYEGLFDLSPGEALLIETEIPRNVRYWSAVLGDPIYGTIDYMHRQTSINAHQARIDSDGSFRAVVAMVDPGVHNWLDTGGYDTGIVQFRWNRADTHPVPTITKVRIADLKRHLPHDTPACTPEERDLLLRRRREGAQLRRRW